jgi:uncharacterized protein
MMFFYDTSALLKLYINELHSDSLRAVTAHSKGDFVCQITWVEMCAALARRVRTGETVQELADTALAQLEQLWPEYQQLTVDAHLIQVAGQHAQAFGLRAYDSVQLASAKLAHQALQGGMVFCCYDKSLNLAASALGMQLLPKS